MKPRPPTSTLFPYTTLFRSNQEYRLGRADFAWPADLLKPPEQEGQWLLFADDKMPLCWFRLSDQLRPDSKAMLNELKDRKSTRLNSSHVRISYAVFCLKKKN